MTEPSHRTALAFMAHPDDAEFLCAGTLIRLADAGWEVHIASATAGDCGTMTENRWDISSTRTREAVTAAARIGATYHCLGEQDGLVVYDKTTVRRTYDLFRRIVPSLVFVHARSDYMLDHEEASRLGRAASFLFAAPNASTVPRDPRSRVGHLYYCDPVEAIDAFGHPVEPTTRVDISEQLEAKAEMLACHASQRQWLLAHHGEDEYLAMMRRHATLRGSEAGCAAAEGFVQHRGHAYPRDDLLEELFGG